ncbi:alpha/beta hydrolase [Streptomyces lunaelactis]|uniref:alpha/beta fold hydrolase n=1 Tax=Streptomyces lunaelactis TaxID=1535768 RepID=UPI0015856FF5|nr:alpha/beta hydrolase [Streptomyces lunaelactis]NUK36380.1 alpha/beta hydrolase [Streptomyces lunaelactis]NUK42871.1 alpha/beta hydrolase [Streptomyces lunaelactis]NUK93480.1 alpha/beta hydrolase [Streptomyces lunaelactis]NUL32927.1 alpha/beta hydrolase [Streptomyces lunaelactis]
MTSAALTGSVLRSRIVDGLAIRHVDTGEQSGPTLLMTSPWPESLLAFRRIWPRLAPMGRLVAVDLPGFGHSEGRTELFTPSAMGDFLYALIGEWGLGTPHVLGPDVGTGAALFLAARHPASVASVIVGSGGAAYPLDVSGALADMIAAPDLGFLHDFDARASIGAVVEAAAPKDEEPEVWEDYVSAYEDGRFAESARYVRAYPAELPLLGDLLPSIMTAVLVMSAEHDELVPPSNGVYLHDRLPNSRLVSFNSGHFPWEQASAAYGATVARWLNGEHARVADA